MAKPDPKGQSDAQSGAQLPAEFEAQFEARKRDHLRHALDPANQAAGLTGLDRVHLNHEALPDLDLEEVGLSSLCLGQPARTPFFVAGMTAGHPDAMKLNRLLAQSCEARGWAMGLGSQRRELETGQPEAWQELREAAPRLTLFSNLGLSQLAGRSTEELLKPALAVKAQALVIHANALQEALQPEGTPRFKGTLAALQRLCRESSLPVILKETGCGFAPATLRRLAGSGLAALDVSGLGGTHWGRIEGARARGQSLSALASETFATWGEPTAESVRAARKLLGGELEVWASGGVRSGLDAAKLIALGADRVGYAQPALEAAMQGAESLARWMERQEFELRVALFCTGCKTPLDLRNKEDSWRASAT